jgi:hypothetical protein
MKNKIILILLFVFPLVTYMIFSSAKHNSLFLPIISKNNIEINTNWKTIDSSKVFLKDKITVLGFVGTNISDKQADLFNLNQKIYNKYYGFDGFQIIMVAPLGTENQVKALLEEFGRVTGNDMKGWKFVFTTPSEITNYYKTFNLSGNLDSNLGTPSVIIIDKELAHRGRKGTSKKGIDEYKESYIIISAAELHNEMTDDVKIVLREYRLALKKNKRKDDFRDGIINQVEKQKNK